MNTLNQNWLHLVLFLVIAVLNLTACGITSEVINHEANDQRLLKAGALDVPIAEIYKKYQYSFLDKYKISHDFIMAKGCSYYAKPVGIKDVILGTNYAIAESADIFEKDEHTYVKIYQKKDVNKQYPISIDRYTRPEYIQGTDSNGNPMIAKGFNPTCGQVWQLTNHSLSISLVKLSLNDAIKRYSVANVPLQKQVIGKNTWITQATELAPRQMNSYAGEFLVSILPIEDTGYTFIFKLKANQDSLQYPQAHAQMQTIFKHLIESVKIEPIK